MSAGSSAIGDPLPGHTRFSHIFLKILLRFASALRLRTADYGQRKKKEEQRKKKKYCYPKKAILIATSKEFFPPCFFFRIYGDMSKMPNRPYLLCPLCQKTKDCLSVHLRRQCMKNSTPEAINAAVEKAKKEAHEVLAFGRVFHYMLLRQIFDDAEPLARMMEELERRHMVVPGVPPPLPNANVAARPPTTETSKSAAPEAGESVVLCLPEPTVCEHVVVLACYTK